MSTNPIYREPKNHGGHWFVLGFGVCFLCVMASVVMLSLLVATEPHTTATAATEQPAPAAEETTPAPKIVEIVAERKRRFPVARLLRTVADWIEGLRKHELHGPTADATSVG